MKTLRIHNSLTDKIEEFKPINPNLVKVYICGMTVYDYMHIGHARTYVSFDAFIRFLRFLGYNVLYVQNITDVDDKIINRANETKTSTYGLSERFVGEVFEDMDALGIERANFYPKVTDHMDEIIALIQKIISKGLAYESAGNVYFDVKKFKSYGKLSNQKIDELIAGKRVEPGEGKKNPADFALWKKSKSEEPSWNSPWGKGRPGWHIECSAMSTKYLGESFDIHGGARDLKFPHHDNEIAQSESATGKQFVKYWMHTGFLNVNGEKMAKSLGNFITVRDLLKKYDSESFRLFVLQYHYRSPVDFTYDKINDAKKALDRAYNAYELMRHMEEGDEKDKKVAEKISKMRENFVEKLCDDFNTPEALNVFFDFIRISNDYVNSGKKAKDVKEESLKFFSSFSQIFGVLKETKKSAEVEPFIDLIVQMRNVLRKEKKWDLTDELRKKLKDLGVALDDSSEESKWKFVSEKS